MFCLEIDQNHACVELAMLIAKVYGHDPAIKQLSVISEPINNNEFDRFLD